MNRKTALGIPAEGCSTQRISYILYNNLKNYVDIFDKFDNIKVPLVIGTIFFMLIIVCIIGTLIFTRTITPSQRANDIIMLITLLVSLPSHFYVRLIKHYVSK